MSKNVSLCARASRLHDILLNVAKEHATEDRKMLGQKKKKADALMETRIDAVTFMNNFGTVHELMVTESARACSYF